jgi:hypothetical protein
MLRPQQVMQRDDSRDAGHPVQGEPSPSPSRNISGKIRYTNGQNLTAKLAHARLVLWREQAYAQG